MTVSPTVLIISFSDHARDPRVQRQIQALQHHCRLLTMGYAPANGLRKEFFPIDHCPKPFWGKCWSVFQLILRQHDGYYRRQSKVKSALTYTPQLKPDVIIANDLETLPLALSMAPRGRVLVDLHEYSPDERGNDFLWKLLFSPHCRYLTQKYIPQAFAATTVSPGLARLYTQDCHTPIEVITNASKFEQLDPTPVKPEKIRLVHHGLAAPSRRLKSLFQVMDCLPSHFSLTLYLVPVEDQPHYFHSLKKEATARPNILLKEPVPFERICSELNQYDVGLIPIHPSNKSLKYCLPNKLFEFVQARLAVVSYPLADVREIVERHQIGTLSPEISPSSMAETLAQLTPQQIFQWKNNSHQAAHTLSSNANELRWQRLIHSVQD